MLRKKIHLHSSQYRTYLLKYPNIYFKAMILIMLNLLTLTNDSTKTVAHFHNTKKTFHFPHLHITFHIIHNCLYIQVNRAPSNE